MRGGSTASLVLQLAILFFPWRVRRLLLVKLLGYQIHPAARIARSLVLSDRVVLGEGAVIKNLTLIKALTELIIEPHGRIGNLNWIAGSHGSDSSVIAAEPGRNSALFVGESASITNRHYLDCTNRITIGRFTTVGGFRSQFMTSSIDHSTRRLSSSPIDIADYCFIGTGVVISKGAGLGRCCVLGAGSTLTHRVDSPYKIVSGCPAQPVRDLNPTNLYFSRATAGVY